MPFEREVNVLNKNNVSVTNTEVWGDVGHLRERELQTRWGGNTEICGSVVIIGSKKKSDANNLQKDAN